MTNIDLSKIITKEAIEAAQKIEEARRYLNETDWIVIRSMDDGKPMPSKIKAERKKARKTISDLS